MLRPQGCGSEVDSELIELSDVIADIYDAAISPPLWQQTLGRICGYIGGNSAVLYWHESTTERSEIAYLFNEAPEYTRLYFEKYQPMDPVFPAATFIDEGAVSTIERIMPRSEFVQTRFYKEWAKPQGIEDAISVNLEKGMTRVAMIAVRTGSVPDQTMRTRMTALVPHLQRAVAICRLFDQSKATEQALTTTLDHVEAAVFLVNGGSEISFANDPARKLLEEASLMHSSDNALRAVGPENDRILQDIIAAAENGDASLGARGVAIPLIDASQQRWFAHVLPLTSGRRQEAARTNHAIAAIFIRKNAPNAPPPLEAIAKLHKLTATEVRVLDVLLKVTGVKAMADTLGLSESTVRSHLHNLFRKTKTANQGDLIKLVAGL